MAVNLKREKSKFMNRVELGRRIPLSADKRVLLIEFNLEYRTDSGGVKTGPLLTLILFSHSILKVPLNCQICNKI